MYSNAVLKINLIKKKKLCLKNEFQFLFKVKKLSKLFKGF